MASILASRALQSLGAPFDSIYCRRCSGNHTAHTALLQRASLGNKRQLVLLTKRHLVTHEFRRRPLPRPRDSLFSSMFFFFSRGRAQCAAVVSSNNPRARPLSTSSQPSSPSTSLSENVRDLMRSVPHPVAIITSTATYTAPAFNTKSDTSGSPGGSSLDLFRGATVSSFNTVTLNPAPVVSFNITRHSSTFRAIQLSGLFNVHLLASDSIPHGQDDSVSASRHRAGSHAELIANKFSRGNEGRPFHRETGEVEDWIDLSASFGRAGVGQASREAARLPPVIRGRTDDGAHLVPFRLLCEHLAEKTVWIGDHVVVFGRVIGVVDNLNSVSEKNDDDDDDDNKLRIGHGRKATLAYVHGKYARVV